MQTDHCSQWESTSKTSCGTRQTKVQTFCPFRSSEAACGHRDAVGGGREQVKIQPFWGHNCDAGLIRQLWADRAKADLSDVTTTFLHYVHYNFHRYTGHLQAYNDTPCGGSTYSGAGKLAVVATGRNGHTKTIKNMTGDYEKCRVCW
jgi:hypothetical protein